jgi:hypothetical protein
MRLNRGLLFWGLAFITAGAVALGVRHGYIPSTWFADAWRLWPLILIAIGLSIIFARTAFAVLGLIIGALLLGSFAGALLSAGPGVVADCGTTSTGAGSTQTKSGSFTGNATVRLSFNCGSLNVNTASGNDWNVNATSAREGTPQIDSGTDQLTVSTPSQGFFGDAGRQDWTVTLPTGANIAASVEANAARSTFDLKGADLRSLGVDANAGQVHLDLSGTQVRGLDLELNAGSASVVLDGQSMVQGELSTNAGSIDLCAPVELGLRIELDDNVAFGNNLDESGLNRNGDIWQSSNYDSATARATLNVSGNAGSFNLNPSEGCQ